MSFSALISANVQQMPVNSHRTEHGKSLYDCFKHLQFLLAGKIGQPSRHNFKSSGSFFGNHVIEQATALIVFR